MTRKYFLARNYEMSMNEYTALLRSQDGKCAICEQPFEEKTPCVDHNHETGEVRALLCNACNTGIGMLQDDPHIVLKALQYLRSHQ